MNRVSAVHRLAAGLAVVMFGASACSIQPDATPNDLMAEYYSQRAGAGLVLLVEERLASLDRVRRMMAANLLIGDPGTGACHHCGPLLGPRRDGDAGRCCRCCR